MEEENSSLPVIPEKKTLYLRFLNDYSLEDINFVKKRVYDSLIKYGTCEHVRVGPNKRYVLVRMHSEAIAEAIVKSFESKSIARNWSNTLAPRSIHPLHIYSECSFARNQPHYAVSSPAIEPQMAVAPEFIPPLTVTVGIRVDDGTLPHYIRMPYDVYITYLLPTLTLMRPYSYSEDSDS